MVRLALVLAIAGGLVLFALQNLTPIPLVILGVPSQALPLMVWVVGAIIAGALTTLLISGLLSASNAFSTPRSRRPKRKPSPNRVSGSASTAWSSTQNTTKATSSTASRTSPTTSVMGDDWEPRQPLEEWEDWDGYDEPAKPSSIPQTRYDTGDRSPTNARYAPPEDFTPPARDEEVWDDWDEDESEDDRREYDQDYESDYSRRRNMTYESDPEASYPPRRTDFEVPQEPVTRRQSGSIYSYSYRDPAEVEDSGVGKTEDVYDAEYRVITPPYNPEPDDAYGVDASSENELDPEEPEDWLDDDLDVTENEASDRHDKPRRGDSSTQDTPHRPNADDW